MSRPHELYYVRFKICFHFYFFFVCIYIFSYSSKTTCSTRKCMQLILSNGCHSLSSCLTCFCLFFNILIIFYLPVRSKVRLGSFYITSKGGCLHCFVFSLTFRKDQIYMCVNTTQGVCVQSAVQCNRYICSRKNRFHLTLLIQSTYPEEGHLTH